MTLYQLNEQHHRDRAEYWLQQGRPDYSKGSIRKAHKWQTKRREFDYALNGAYPKTEMNKFMDDYISERSSKYANAFVSALMGN